MRVLFFATGQEVSVVLSADVSPARKSQPVIPAKAGIQFKYVVRSTQNLYVVCCARHV
jgi:hypothetical protein